ncbi:low molecular weight phosphatase family protein [Ruficoccus amylovorans]|uniref:Low molecular weight phosphatase family protein n=1 Tax=Ruficoccus amylovorans TaxID=1804625 RepID=A0A842HDQ6_9BACT|nr:low molecular weight phosphatase family protein [Ruficoccus amylovorans]MBC2594350.1 low molecular weight phosphatase family protein [Ruficoccus amylovorans]
MSERYILFVCTGNYYRSRFAEAVFNHGAQAEGLPWRAFSRGLFPGWVEDNSDLSPHTRAALATRGIPLHHTGSKRTQLTREDMERAAHTIVLKKTEHHPMMRKAFPELADQVEYWEVHDIDFADPAEALPEIEQLVQNLIEQLKRNPEGNFLRTGPSKA